MSEMRIQGGLEEPGFDRFRILRDQAQNRLRRTDMETRLQDAIQRQQAIMGKTNASAAAMQPGGAGQYARAGALERPDPKPALGQVLDIMA